LIGSLDYYMNYYMRRTAMDGKSNPVRDAMIVLQDISGAATMKRF